MTTDLIYLRDAYLRRLDAEVTKVDPEGRRVALDRTILYPTGGGQPHDTGVLGDHQVVDVRKDGDDVWHSLAPGPVALPEPGRPVSVEVDWARRHALMRTHTALHVLCGVIWNEWRVPVTGGNMEPLTARMDFEFDPLPAGFGPRVEELVNAELAADRPIEVTFLARADAVLDDALIRTKVSLVPETVEQVRVVDILGLDKQADGGTHVRTTSEVGRVVVLKTESKGKAFKRIRLAVEDTPAARAAATGERAVVTLTALRRHLSGLDRVVVAFSGGVDSGLLAAVAHEVLGAERCLAVTAVSESLLPSERDDCRRYAATIGMRWSEVGTAELDRPGYVANGPDRCYHCKSELMDRLIPVARSEGAVVALGVNLDDLTDHRPGQRAARERGAAFPLVDAGLDKAAVRRAAREMGLPFWDKPAAACLASRLPYGTPVTLGTLGRVARAEEALRRLGFRQLRVRHYGDLARIELPEEDMARAVTSRADLVGAVTAAGYRYVTLDLEGFRSGNLNAGLAP